MSSGYVAIWPIHIGENLSYRHFLVLHARTRCYYTASSTCSASCFISVQWLSVLYSTHPSSLTEKKKCCATRVSVKTAQKNAKVSTRNSSTLPSLTLQHCEVRSSRVPESRQLLWNTPSKSPNRSTHTTVKPVYRTIIKAEYTPDVIRGTTLQHSANQRSGHATNTPREEKTPIHRDSVEPLQNTLRARVSNRYLTHRIPISAPALLCTVRQQKTNDKKCCHTCIEGVSKQASSAAPRRRERRF